MMLEVGYRARQIDTWPLSANELIQPDCSTHLFGRFDSMEFSIDGNNKDTRTKN